MMQSCGSPGFGVLLWGVRGSSTRSAMPGGRQVVLNSSRWLVALDELDNKSMNQRVTSWHHGELESSASKTPSL